MRTLMTRPMPSQVCCRSRRCAATRALQGIRRHAERHAKGIADRLENVAAPRLEGLAQQRIVQRQGGGHGVGIVLPQTRAALDVGEEKRDGAGEVARACG